MGFLNYRTERVDLGMVGGDGPFWVEIREMTQGQAAHVEGVLASGVQANMNTGDGSVNEGAIGRWRVEQLAECVSDWNLTDENDNLLPLKPKDDLRKALRSLPFWAFNRVHEATEKMSQAAVGTAEDDARFPESTDVDTTGELSSRRDAPGPGDVSATPVVPDGAGNEL